MRKRLGELWSGEPRQSAGPPPPLAASAGRGAGEEKRRGDRTNNRPESRFRAGRGESIRLETRNFRSDSRRNLEPPSPTSHPRETRNRAPSLEHSLPGGLRLSRTRPAPTPPRSRDRRRAPIGWRNSWRENSLNNNFNRE